MICYFKKEKGEENETKENTYVMNEWTIRGGACLV